MPVTFDFSTCVSMANRAERLVYDFHARCGIAQMIGVDPIGAAEAAITWYRCAAIAQVKGHVTLSEWRVQRDSLIFETALTSRDAIDNLMYSA